MDKLFELEKRIGYSFKNKELLNTALSHSSYVNEKGLEYCANNERLEFLGDAYLDAIIGEELFRYLPNEEEGRLTKLRAQIVCEQSLVKVASEYQLGEFIKLGSGELKNGGSNRPSILADAVEAILAAIYLDSGIDEARAFVLKSFESVFKDALNGKGISDFKTALQEKLQSLHESIDISYRLINEEGPDHNKSFTMGLYINNKLVAKGKDKSKKAAEQKAAEEGLNSMKDMMEGSEGFVF